MGNFPTIADIRVIYGRNAAETWLMIQLSDLNNYVGVQRKMNERQLEELARMLVAEHYHLKLTEFMLFMRYFKSGKFGEFYGAVDPIVITAALPKFMKERNAIIDKAEADDYRQRLEASSRSADHMTYEEWRSYQPFAAAGLSMKVWRYYLQLLESAWCQPIR